MFRTTEYGRRLLIGIIAIAAILQWSVVIERAWAAVWAWYKFAGYGGVAFQRGS